jgi:hypothetical protein
MPARFATAPAEYGKSTAFGLRLRCAFDRIPTDDRRTKPLILPDFGAESPA